MMRRLWPLMLDRLLYGDLRKALLVSEIVSIIEESPDPDSPVMRRLKRAIGYESAGRRKRALRIVPICPPEGVEAPGTFGFGESRAIASLMRQGYDDAHRILAQQRPAGPAGTAVRAT
ncbi:MAG: hypothetical protein IMX02_02870 [Limnochordaceae bacterium]|nr:hypothetical protein [Limnochordaceae bacterium]